MEKFKIYDKFVKRHIGPSEEQVKNMLKVVKVGSLDEMIDKTIPSKIRLKEKVELDDPVTENDFLSHLKEIASKNKVFKSYIGMGYYPTITPPVIIRNILENPGWYTQYTPYQAEISQGRLEALLNFQTMLTDLTGMPLANASLLDEGTSAAEAMGMLYSARKRDKKTANVFLVDEKCYSQTIDILISRAEPQGIEVKVTDLMNTELSDDIFGLLVQYPDSNGQINDYNELFKKADEKQIFKAVAADLLSLALLTPPGEFGADVVVGSTQRFGVPMGYGGPHAGYFATKEEFKRQIPGRIIGISVDSKDRRALRMALQTREQHIKREKATSNICTAQVLLAIMASMYAVYHGPKGIKAIAERIYNLTNLLDLGLKKLGIDQVNSYYFDTLKVKLDQETIEKVKNISIKKEINLRYFENEAVGIALSELTKVGDIKEILDVLADASSQKISDTDIDILSKEITSNWPENFKRQSDYLTHPVFNDYHSETEMLRYIKNLERKDLSLTTSMIPLGSCTMKLNAAAEMLGLSWPEFGQLHPFIPRDQAEGYAEIITAIEKQLCNITGFSGASVQPNSGAQGEYAGLMVIRAYHKNRGDNQRNVVLIPASAHGTNPASAIMAGGKVVVVACDDEGNIDLEDLNKKAEEHKDNLSALMVTYPSTHGVFEENICEITNIIHKYGGQVYMDGANMNAQVGLTSPMAINADVCHFNLHKTFSIPHGGGGPGVGPIAVAEHLVPFLPGHSVVDINGDKSIKALSAAPWGSASVLPISYGYIKMMGTEGLTYATQIAILNANYLKEKLAPYFDVLYKGKQGFVGHELIFDLRYFKASTGVEVEDVAKRLMDYGYHAPTVSFPVPGTLMVEPTESESQVELDRFCEAMISIRKEIDEIADGKADKEDNVLKNAPHTAEDVINDNWNHKYSREEAAFPMEWTRKNKFWPSVGRVNNAYGDRNLICSCLPISEYEESK
ncbi:aminomethyl-transferring glycine dehydrogenase [Bacteroidota bacterium]